MFFKVIFTIIALGFSAFIALQSKATVDIRILSNDISIPVAVLVCCFLMLGFGIGVIWRKFPKETQVKVQNNQVPIITNLKVYE